MGEGSQGGKEALSKAGTWTWPCWEGPSETSGSRFGTKLSWGYDSLGQLGCSGLSSKDLLHWSFSQGEGFQESNSPACFSGASIELHKTRHLFIPCSFQLGSGLRSDKNMDWTCSWKAHISLVSRAYWYHLPALPPPSPKYVSPCFLLSS